MYFAVAVYVLERRKYPYQAHKLKQGFLEPEHISKPVHSSFSASDVTTLLLLAMLLLELVEILLLLLEVALSLLVAFLDDISRSTPIPGLVDYAVAPTYTLALLDRRKEATSARLLFYTAL